MKNPRFNPLGIQMIPELLHRKLFGRHRQPRDPSIDRRLIIDQLRRSIQNIEFKSTNKVAPISHPWETLTQYLPQLKNDYVIDHLNDLGRHFSEPYLKRVDKLLKISDSLVDDNRPKRWNFQPGWTRYDPSTGQGQPVDQPKEDSLVFDVEVCLEKANINRPTLAVALSPTCWYSWCSESLINARNDDSDKNLNFSFGDLSPQDLISMGNWNDCERLIVGHNVSFDRSYISEQYFMQLDRTRFLDTMSMHICVSGLNQEQKVFAIRNGNPWNAISSLNNLSDVYKLYCNTDVGVAKDPRDIFVKGTMTDVYDNFQFLTGYCAEDVAVTLKILRHLFPQFQQRFPSPITLAGMLEMSVMYLPVNRHTWKRYLNESQSIYNQYKMEINETLKEIASETCSALHQEAYKKDPWLWDLDWTTRTIGFKKSHQDVQYEKLEKDKLIAQLNGTSKHLKKNQPILPGYPKWFVDLCENSKLINRMEKVDLTEIIDFDQFNISPKLRTIPKILKLMWNGFPLYYDKTYAWGYLVPCPGHDGDGDFGPGEAFQIFLKNAGIQDLDLEAGIKDIVPGCLFYKLPHKNGPNQRVGNPLAKDFIRKISDGTLKPLISTVNDLVVQQNIISYWTNSSKRILSQMVLTYDADGNGAILPRVIVSGTVTRRAVEPTWLTASNSYKDRLGSELKGMIQCPPGYSYVGADVDSQELWIASLLGDSHYCGVQGATGLGWMTLQGDKSTGTDMHSVTARTINISRDEAKVLNYARIYGSGREFASRFLKQSNPTLSEEEAKDKARKIFLQTKGLRRKFKKEMEDGIVLAREWYGGTESHMFNKLEEIATNLDPETPVLRCRISRALEPEAVGYDYMTSRINWVVQSSAVDFLHILLVCMKWLMAEYDAEGRFSISIHDEIRYIVPNRHRYRTALALQFANLLTRCYFTAALNLNDLPASIAFFSSVEIDRCLRKEAGDDCHTPSNRLGLAKGYGIPAGDSLNVSRLLQCLEREDPEFVRFYTNEQDDQRKSPASSIN